MNVSSFPQAVSAQRTRYCGIWLYINFSTHSRKNGWNDRKNRILWTPTVKYHTTQKYDIQNGVNWVWCCMSIMQALCTYRQEDHQFKSSSPLLGIQDQSETKEIPANQTKKNPKEQHTLLLIFSFILNTNHNLLSLLFSHSHPLPPISSPPHPRQACSLYF